LSLSAILVHLLVPVSRATSRSTRTRQPLTFVQSALSGLMVPLSRVVHSIVCCRILLNLRQAASPRGPLTIVRSIGLAFPSAPGQETIQLEMHNARNGEEDFPRQADEGFIAGHRVDRFTSCFVLVFVYWFRTLNEVADQPLPT